MVTFCGVSKTYETDAGPVLALRPLEWPLWRLEGGVTRGLLVDLRGPLCVSLRSFTT